MSTVVMGVSSQDTTAALADAALVAHAQGLARAGRYAQALDLLARLGERRGHTAAEHDLLARIHAQQGELDAAAEHWRAAAGFGGQAEADAAAGLRRIAAVSRGRVRTRGRAAVAGVAALVLLGGGTAIGWAVSHAWESEPAPTLAVTTTAPAEAPSPLAASATASAAPAPLADLEARVSGPEVTVTHAGDQLVLVFTGQVFSGGATLSPEGAAALARVGARIAAVEGVGVEVVGHSDSLPVPRGSSYADNTALSQARAATAAAALADAGIAPAQLTVSAAGSAVPLYPNTDAERARNRTVTLRLTAPA